MMKQKLTAKRLGLFLGTKTYTKEWDPGYKTDDAHLQILSIVDGSYLSFVGQEKDFPIGWLVRNGVTEGIQATNVGSVAQIAFSPTEQTIWQAVGDQPRSHTGRGVVPVNQRRHIR